MPSNHYIRAMPTSDTIEKGLETLIMRHRTGTDGSASGAAGFAASTWEVMG
jgi:hypothetical protein